MTKLPSCPRCNSYRVDHMENPSNDKISGSRRRMMAMRLGTPYVTKSINDTYCKCYSCHFIGPIDDFFENTEKISEKKTSKAAVTKTSSSDDDCCSIL